jgi:hypothetical protein
VGEDAVDEGGVGDVGNSRSELLELIASQSTGDHPQRAGAQGADGHVELEGALQALGPGQALQRVRRLRVATDGLGGRDFASTRVPGTMRGRSRLFGAKLP